MTLDELHNNNDEAGGADTSAFIGENSAKTKKKKMTKFKLGKKKSNLSECPIQSNTIVIYWGGREVW